MIRTSVPVILRATISRARYVDCCIYQKRSSENEGDSTPQTKTMRILSFKRLLGAGTSVIIATGPLTAETFTLQEATIDQIQAAMAAGALSSVELNSLYLNRIAIYDQNRGGVYLNSVPVPNPDLLTEAAAADARRAQGVVAGPLDGIPVAIKDSMAVKGLPFTHSETEFKDLKAIDDAFIVTRLREAGAVILGKANLVRGAGGSGTSDTWGQAKRAHDKTGLLEPAGSSSGSSIAVSANLTVLGIGGETGSSIRWPAAHQGIVGIRPTKSAVSGSGTFPLAPDRDVLGPLARTVKDAAYCLDALWFRDVEDKLAFTNTQVDYSRPVPFADALGSGSLVGKRFGVISVFGSTDRTKHVPRGVPVPNLWNGTISDDYYASFEVAKQKLIKAGAQLVEIDLPAASAWYATNFDPANTAALANAYVASGVPADVSALNGNRQRSWGPRVFYWESLLAEYGNGAITTFDQYAQTGRAVATWGTDVPARLAAVTALRNDGLAVPITANPYHLNVVSGWKSFYEKYYKTFVTTTDLDAVIAPTAYALNQPFGGVSYGSDCGNGMVNVLGVSGITVPMGANRDGLPTGIQLWGQRWDEENVIQLATAVEQVLAARISTPLAPPLPGETIEYTVPIPPTERAEVDGPALRVASRAELKGKGKGTKLVLSGSALDASGVQILRVYVNGQKVASRFKNDSWQSTIKVSALAKFAQKDSSNLQVLVVSTDALGNTSTTSKTVRLPKNV